VTQFTSVYIGVGSIASNLFNYSFKMFNFITNTFW